MAKSSVLAGGSSPRLTSTEYEMAWKVMKLRPIGSARVSSGSGMGSPMSSRKAPISLAKKP